MKSIVTQAGTRFRQDVFGGRLAGVWWGLPVAYREQKRDERRERCYEGVAVPLIVSRMALGVGRWPALAEVARVASSTGRLLRVCICRCEPDQAGLAVDFAADPAIGCVRQLQQGAAPDQAGGQGSVDTLYGAHGARVTWMDSANAAPWRLAAERGNWD